MKTTNRTVYGLRAKNRGLVYEGSHYSFKEAIHDAIETNIDLSGVDMTGKDLQGLNLDGINLSNADFTNSNLTGANMSEAVFTNCNFSDSILLDACFCYSDLENCQFIESQFGMTDFSEAKIINCAFKGSSALILAFAKAYKISGSVYYHDNQKLKLSQPPKVLLGLKNTIAVFDEHIIFGNDIYSRQDKEVEKLVHSSLLQLLKSGSITG